MCGEKKFIRDEGELFHVNDFIGDVYRSELCLGRDEEWDKRVLLENICFSPKKFRHCLWCHFRCIMKKIRMALSGHGPWFIVRRI